MTTALCKKGCTGADGRPVYHPGLWACPKEVGFNPDKLTKFNERRARAREAMRQPKGTPAAQQPSPPAAPEGTGTPPGAGKPAGEASGALQRIEFGTKVAETARRDAAQKQAEVEWELPAESSETFFLTIRNGFRMVAHWLDDVLDAEKTEEGRIKDSMFELNQHDLAAARGGFGRRLATKVVKALGAKTLEEGIATVDSLAFLMMFGVMFLGMFAHFWKVAEQSPRLKKFRERAAKMKEERAAAKKLGEERRRLTEEQKRNAVTTDAKPAGAPG